jgi:pimeloyl-ACP methyl ester carboxylesterase
MTFEEQVRARVGDPVLVLIHSPLVGPASWLAVADEFARRGREAVVPSLLGVPAAPAPQWRHVPEVVRGATAQTAAPVVLVGHSGAGLLLPVIADAVDVEVAGLVFVDSRLPLSYFEASVPLPGGWGAQPCAYLPFSDEPYAPSAGQAREQGWARCQAPDTWRWRATRLPSPTRFSTSNARSADRARAPHFCSSGAVVRTS